ncbi:hypothetical protein NX059_003266 [Plenodomus lindquistii]|nr:hypothetical protein NX059_003266 [Plenodomus lindquistii]
MDGQEQVFAIHESLITSHSPYFKSALSSTHQDRLVDLPYDDPTIFRYYVHLLYTNKVEASLDCISPNTYGYNECCNIAKLYVLAEKLQDIASKNAAISAMLAAFEERNDAKGIPGSSIIKIVWDGTPSGSKMRKLIVDMWADRATGSWIKKYKGKEWPADFLVDMTMALMEKRAPPNDPDVARDASMYWEE